MAGSRKSQKSPISNGGGLSQYLSNPNRPNLYQRNNVTQIPTIKQDEPKVTDLNPVDQGSDKKLKPRDIFASYKNDIEAVAQPEPPLAVEPSPMPEPVPNPCDSRL